ncbi:GPN-loop GTPase [Nematocida minor]|uniref:GPN-loop GTPase n=1 Tax=Nematocida minor TaxID=1912983 RepID=UPI0022202901|nr:GPN-loop GTPase [Nematocida minor]KAI5189491.1 GPN-loop GTPase [Nematocida minor]
MDNTVLIVLGMAGSGKSTFCHRLYSWLSEKNLKIDSRTGLNDAVCGINLDPAAATVKMPLHYDIRDTVQIHDLMQQKKLGPNGAILTALNLFVTQIDTFISQIVELGPRYTVIDTPGQIEMFTTSISGQILTQCLSRTKGIRVKMVYVVDGEKAQSPQCFISNMLFATSIHYRFNEQLLVVVNKSDMEGSEKIEEWASSFETFAADLPEEEMSTPLTRSIALWMEEFYSNFSLLHVSAATGMGKRALIEEVDRREPDEQEETENKEEKSAECLQGKEESQKDTVIQSILETLKRTTILCSSGKKEDEDESDEETKEDTEVNTHDKNKAESIDHSNR